MNPIPFNRSPITGVEIEYIKHVIESRHLTGDGVFTKRCHAWLESNLQSPKALLTHSCTASLEMAALLCEIKPGDEVIMPSFTFVSTANAFALRGATAVFVDIDPGTQNLDASLIEPALTNRTKAIVPVHYAGISCDMDAIGSIARRHDLKIVEDAAQGLGSTWRGKALGTLGDYGALSFHGTKNIVSGEGGALLVREPERGERAEIIREKGTDRSRFIRGEVDKYTWQELGSSYLPSELIAAFLYAQLEASPRSLNDASLPGPGITRACNRSSPPVAFVDLSCRNMPYTMATSTMCCCLTKQPSNVSIKPWPTAASNRAATMSRCTNHPLASVTDAWPVI